MPHHRLDEIELPGRELALAVDPTFDLYRASRVRRLLVELDGELPTLTLDLEYVVASVCCIVRLRMEGVRRLEIPPAMPLLELPELEIEDVREGGLEGIRYEVVSHFDKSFRCSCRDLAIVAVQP